MNTLAEQLKAWRAASGLTQRQAAAVLGVALPTYRHWEHGDRQPGQFALAAIHAALQRIDPLNQWPGVKERQS